MRPCDRVNMPEAMARVRWRVTQSTPEAACDFVDGSCHPDHPDPVITPWSPPRFTKPRSDGRLPCRAARANRSLPPRPNCSAQLLRAGPPAVFVGPAQSRTGQPRSLERETPMQTPRGSRPAPPAFGAALVAPASVTVLAMAATAAPGTRRRTTTPPRTTTRSRARTGPAPSAGPPPDPTSRADIRRWSRPGAPPTQGCCSGATHDRDRDEPSRIQGYLTPRHNRAGIA